MREKYEKYSTLVLDLDGTLIETIQGNPFPKGVWDMRIKWDAWDGIGYLLRNVNSILIASNQGGISIGKVNESCFKAKILYVAAALRDYLKYKYDLEVVVDTRYCPSNKPCDMRKPNIGMLSNSFVGLTPKDSILFIGDATDKRCAENFGVDYMDVRDFIKDYNTTKIIEDV